MPTFVILICSCLAGANARDFYVSPGGSPNVKGGFKTPWDLQTALNQPGFVKPGDTIWLRGGVYNGAATNGFNCRLAGTSSAPITIKNYPGERAIIDRAGTDSTQQTPMDVYGSYVILWGLEFMNSDPNRNRTSPYTGTVQAWRGPGIGIYGPDNKVINCIIHDNGSGIYDKADRTEIYGCLIYNNGNNGFNHGLYISNNLGTKLVMDNLIFDNAGLGIQSYSANTTSQQKGIHIEGNASFNNGAITLDDQNSTNIVVGAEAEIPAERISVISNYVYDPPAVVSNKSKGIRLGQVDRHNRDGVVRDNYVACKVPMTIQWWDHIEMEGNTIYTPMTSINLQMQAGATTGSYLWDNNTYINGISTGPIFTINSTSGFKLSSWQQWTKLDANSHVIQNTSLRPSGVKVFVRPNKYEAGRGQVIVFNWDLNGSVNADLSSLGLQIGDHYEVRDAQNYFGVPVASGTYDGRLVRLPMALTQVSRPVGNVERVPAHTAPEFAAFVVRKA